MYMFIQADVHACRPLVVDMYCVEMYRGRLFIELVILHVVYMSGRASLLYIPVFYIDKCMCVAILRPLALRCAPPSGGLFGRVSRVFVRAREPVCLLVAVFASSIRLGVFLTLL